MLRDLFNLSHEQRKLPSQWTNAEIRAVPKPQFGAYRPITLLSSLDQVTEAILLKRIRSVQKKFEGNYFGYVPDKGCIDALVTLVTVEGTHVSSTQSVLKVGSVLDGNWYNYYSNCRGNMKISSVTVAEERRPCTWCHCVNAE